MPESLSQRIAAKRAAEAGTNRGGRVATGGVAGAEAGAQHVDMYRKLMLRRAMLRRADPGPIYVPFIGEGDIAAELYADRKIWGADLDPERVAAASKRLTDATVVAGDCDAWPFTADETVTTDGTVFVAADFDSYSYPYNSMRAFFANARTADRMTLFFTDGMRMGILRSTAKQWHHPAGHMVDKGDTNSKRRQWSSYWSRTLLPWFKETMAEQGYVVMHTRFYLRGAGLLYWGAVIERG